MLLHWTSIVYFFICNLRLPMDLFLLINFFIMNLSSIPILFLSVFSLPFYYFNWSILIFLLSVHAHNLTRTCSRKHLHNFMPLLFYFCLHFLCIYLSMYLSIYLSIYVSIYVFANLSICLCHLFIAVSLPACHCSFFVFDTNVFSSSCSSFVGHWGRCAWICKRN